MKLDSRMFMVIVLILVCATVLIAVGRMPMQSPVYVAPVQEKTQVKAEVAPMPAPRVVPVPGIPRGLVPPPPAVPVIDVQ